MKRAGNQNIWIATVAGFLITALAIFFVAILLVDQEERSKYFAYRIIWTEMLGLFIWAYVGGFLQVSLTSGEKGREKGGISPAVGILLTSYCLASFAVMMIHAYLPSSHWADRLHMAVQIILFLIFAVICIFIFFAWRGALAGTPVRKNSEGEQEQ